MRSAERRQEIIQRVLVGHIDRRQVEVHLVAVGVEDVVFAQGGVKQVAWRNALGVLIVVSGVRGRNADQVRGEL